MNDVLNLLKSSKIASLLQNDNVTDISYNGTSIFYVSNIEGRKRYLDVHRDEVMNLLRQIANLTNQLFTYQNPILDVVFSSYRLSAVHPLIGREEHNGTPTFSLRVASRNKNLLEEKGMIDQSLKNVCAQLIATKKSIVISGQTSVGKTEMQKYLIGMLPIHSRVLIIDQGIELSILKSMHPSLDITIWRYDENNSQSSLSNLIKTALRFNPDYLVIAEARGNEILDIYNASLSGHPSIITMHSESEKLVYQRMMAMIGYQNRITKDDLMTIFPSVIQLTKEQVEDRIVRKVMSITSYEPKELKVKYLHYDEKQG